MDISQEGTQLTLTKRELYEKLKNDDNNSQTSGAKPENIILDYVKAKFNLQHCSQPMLQELSCAIHSFMISFNERWKSCHRSKKAFLNKHREWLNTSISIQNVDIPTESELQRVRQPGRPKKHFDLSGLKSKSRKVKSLVAGSTLNELTHATNLKLRQSGKRDAASMLGKLVSSPKRASKIKKVFQKEDKQITKYSPEEALALIHGAKLSQRRYDIIRKSAKAKGLNIYPSYEQIKNAKTLCYPPNEDCVITESMAEVTLQSIVDLTIKRLSLVQCEVLSAIIVDEVLQIRNVTMIFKWGCDGSGGQSRYKQKADTENFEDANVLTTSLVPLQMFGYNERNKRVILWQNPRPSSTSYCRPIKFIFAKETEELVLDEFKSVRDQISTIVPTLVEFNGTVIEVAHIFEETMVDGKVCNILASNKATQKCYICQATPRDMNNLEMVRKRKSEAEKFSWGLSTLHAQIRLMECVLHIAYRLDVQKWQCRKAEEKESVATRKKHIIDQFRSKTGLLLDTPKQGGGNTNDGNSARKFFKNPAVSAEITGVNKNIIERFYVILRALTSGYEINIDTFKSYCDETAELYVSLYHWYPMPVTLHKLLLHGPEVIQKFLLPIGQMSEEAQESRHKEFRKFRLEYSRKVSRKLTNTDILHNLLISSDPVITSLAAIEKTKALPIDPAVLRLIQPPNIISITEEQQKNDSDDNGSDSDNTTGSESN